MHDCASNRALDSLPSRFECLQVSRVFLRKYACNLSKKISASFDLQNRCAFLGQFQGTPGTGGTTGRDDPDRVNFTVKTFVVYTALNS